MPYVRPHAAAHATPIWPKKQGQSDRHQDYEDARNRMQLERTVRVFPPAGIAIQLFSIKHWDYFACVLFAEISLPQTPGFTFAAH